MRQFLKCIITILFLASSISAFNGNGSISSEIYSFESDSVVHYQFYQSLQSRMQLYQKSNKQITLSTYGRWRTDLENGVHTPV